MFTAKIYFFINFKLKQIVGQPHVLPLLGGYFSSWTPVEQPHLCVKHLEANVLEPCVTSSTNFLFVGALSEVWLEAEHILEGVISWLRNLLMTAEKHSCILHNKGPLK